MKSNQIFFFFFFLPLISMGQWTQFGMDIDGVTAGDRSGESISLSADGSVLAVGSNYNSALAPFAGQVKVYDWDGNNWIQRGGAINGTQNGGNFGSSVCISDDGLVIAAGAPGYVDPNQPSMPGYTEIYEWNGSSWEQRGLRINGVNSDDSAGAAISLNADGSILAVGASSYSGVSLWAGHVRIFEWDGSAWGQLGNDIGGEAASDFSGSTVDLNSAGNVIAITASGNDANGNASGHCRVFDWNGTAWIQKGQDLGGQGSTDGFGADAAIDDSGNTLIVSGLGQFFTGYAKVFSWNGTNWVQKGSTLNGDTGSDFFGNALDINADGNIIIIGAFGNNSGYARVLQFNGSDWVQVGEDILGETQIDQFGRSTSMSASGGIVAVGTPFNDGNGSNTGHVRVFRNLSIAPAEGCTYSSACNYNALATADDGSCDFNSCLSLGCTYALALNYNPTATTDDGSCIYESCNNDCPNDINNDGVVNTGDLNSVLATYGTICD